MTDETTESCSCIRCKSDRIYKIESHGEDLHTAWFKGAVIVDADWPPSVETCIVDGIAICLQCGQTQGVFPAADPIV